MVSASAAATTVAREGGGGDAPLILEASVVVVGAPSSPPRPPEVPVVDGVPVPTGLELGDGAVLHAHSRLAMVSTMVVLREPGEVTFLNLTQVKLKPHVSEQGDMRPQVHAEPAPRDVAGRGTDMHARNGQRQEQVRVALDVEAVKRIIRVRDPHALGPGEHAVITAPAAARTSFDLDAGMRGAQPFDERMHAFDLRLVSRASEITVHVPLEIADVTSDQLGMKHRTQVIPYIGARQVEHGLVTLQRRRARIRPDPVGMLSRKVAVRVDHFRFDP